MRILFVIGLAMLGKPVPAETLRSSNWWTRFSGAAGMGSNPGAAHRRVDKADKQCWAKHYVSLKKLLL